MGLVCMEIQGVRLLTMKFVPLLPRFSTSVIYKAEIKNESSANRTKKNKSLCSEGENIKSLRKEQMINRDRNVSSTTGSTVMSNGPTFLINNDLWFDINSLDGMPRRQLQKLCTKFGVRAISKTEKLVEDLKHFHQQNLCKPSSILHSPFIPGAGFSSRTQQRSPESLIAKDMDNTSGLFASLDVSSSSFRRDEELQRLCRQVGARSTSSRTTANSLDSLKSDLGEMDKSFRVLADTGDVDKVVFPKKPSVSTILNFASNKNKAFIISRWRKKKIEEMGDEAFKKYQSDITRKGRVFHSCVKNVLSGNHANIDGVQGCLQSVSDVFKDISSVIATEKRVSHFYLGYSGFLDTLALYKGIPCLIEWKTSEKQKESLADCHDFPVQVAAYAGAINSSPYFSVPITTGLIVVAYHDGTPAHVHKMDMQTCDYYWQQWLVRVFKYKKTLDDNQNSNIQ